MTVLYRVLPALLVALLPALAPTARAETHRVDDSASIVEAHNVTLKWGRPGAGTRLQGTVTVHARLDVSPWQGRIARIYLTLPPSAAPPVDARWTTRGRLLPGTLQPGGRTLVHAGPILSPTLEDTLELELHADSRELERPEQLAFAFEIDLETP